MKELVVNADDYGLTEGHSRAILAAHFNGIVTSTSVLSVGPASPRTVGWLRGVDTLGVGAHLAAVGEDPPLLSPREIPTLVDRAGRFPRSWRGFVQRMVMGSVDPADLFREFDAQLMVLKFAGPSLTHVDCHQHLHLFPMVRKVVLKLASTYDIRAVRIPRASWIPGRLAGAPLNVLARATARDALREKLIFCDAAEGFDQSGAFTAPRMVRALQRLAASGVQACELSTHPGQPEDPERTRYLWKYRWGEELAALTAPATRAEVDRLGFKLVHYGSLSNRSVAAHVGEAEAMRVSARAL